MEMSWWYHDYGLTYYEISGTTEIHNARGVLRRFEGLGYIKGKELAETWIDKQDRMSP